MLPLLAEVHFWSLTDNAFSSVMDTQLSVHRYHSRKEEVLTTSLLSKKEYNQRRGYRWCLPNKRPVKLRESLKELQASYISECMVRAEWISYNTCFFTYNSGLIVVATINLNNGNLSEIIIDKFLKDKLQWDSVCDVVIKERLVVCCSSEHKLNAIQFDKSFLDRQYVRLSNLDPKIIAVELPAPVGRRLVRRLAINKSSELIAVWWTCDDDDVYPWSANVKEVDRANVHIYVISGSSIQLMCYHRTEYNSLNVLFSNIQSNILYIMQQRISASKVHINMYIDKYEIIKYCQLQKRQSHSIEVNSRIICAQLSPDERKILLCCVDGSLVLHNHSTGLTYHFTSVFVAKIVRWHPNNQLFIIASENGELQLFDFALNCLKIQIISEDITPCNVLDMACYFKDPIEIFDIKWNENDCMVENRQDCFLLVILKEGPIATFRMICVNSITSNVLVQHYLQNNQINRACCLLLATDWNSSAKDCFIILKNIVQHVLMSSSCQYIIQQYEHLECALSSYYNPIEELTEAVQIEYGKLIKNLTRMITHKLVRYEIFDKAFTLICMLDHHDLYMDLYYSCTASGNATLAAAAWNRAHNQQLLSDSLNSNSDSCDCFDSDCECVSYNDCIADESQSIALCNNESSGAVLTVPNKPTTTFRAVLKPLHQNAPDIENTYQNHFDQTGTNIASTSQHQTGITCDSEKSDAIIAGGNKKAIKVVHFGVV